MPAGICSRQRKSSLLKENLKELAYVAQDSISSRRNPDLRLCTLSGAGIRMSRLAGFFKDADTRLGVFYPDHALIAIFPDIKRAQNAKGKLCGAGFSDDEALVVAGADLIDLVHEESARSGVLGYLTKKVSRFLHTEVVYTDHDLIYARRGAAVLAVHCPDERTKKTAWRLIAPTDPLAARHYSISGIEHLAGES